MKQYKPDGWALFKVISVSSNEVKYKIFGSWNASFIEPPCWRLSSGSSRLTGALTECDITISQESGSEYVLDSNLYNNLNMHSRSVFNKLMDESKTLDPNIINLSMLTIETDENGTVVLPINIIDETVLN